MNAANLLYRGSLFCCILGRGSTTLSNNDADVLQMFIKDVSILRRPRNFFVIIAVYIYETINIPRAVWLSPSPV